MKCNYNMVSIYFFDRLVAIEQIDLSLTAKESRCDKDQLEKKTTKRTKKLVNNNRKKNSIVI